MRVSAGGTPNFRIFTINSGKTVTISGLTISNGNAPSGFFPANSGGGILNSGNLTINNSAVSANTATAGGGISSLGPLTLKSSVVSGNTASNGSGGGISNDGPITVTIVNSTISGNNAINGAGGGVSNSVLGSTMTLSISNSTISGNNGGGNGGGIHNRASQGATIIATITNGTISGNTSGFGGGIANVSETPGTTVNLAINNGTISGNNAAGSSGIGGGIANHEFGSTNTLTLRNTIVAGNFHNGAGTSDISSTVDPTSSFNLIGDGTGMSGVSNGSNGNKVGTSGAPIAPLLGPLTNNGGPTMTHALLPGSPALDAGSNSFVTNPPFGGPPFTDQRGTGFNRIVDGPDADTIATVDIGAFEQQVSLADIADTNTNEDTQLIGPFDGGDTSSIPSVTATSDNPTLIPNDSAHLSVAVIGSTGIVTINPATNLNGTSNITVTVNRTGGSGSKTFMLTVNPVNDARSFTKGPDQTVTEDAGAETVNNWAANMSAGPPDESGQTLTFQVTGNTNAGLFAVAPAISSTGTLTYTPAANANGSAPLR